MAPPLNDLYRYIPRSLVDQIRENLERRGINPDNIGAVRGDRPEMGDFVGALLSLDVRPPDARWDALHIVGHPGQVTISLRRAGESPCSSRAMKAEDLQGLELDRWIARWLEETS